MPIPYNDQPINPTNPTVVATQNNPSLSLFGATMEDGYFTNSPIGYSRIILWGSPASPIKVKVMWF